jgi:hypothetical protein
MRKVVSSSKERNSTKEKAMKAHKFDDEGYCKFKLGGFTVELIDDTLEIKSIESPRLVGLTSSGATHAEPNYASNEAVIEAKAYFCGEAAPRTIKIPVSGSYWLGNPVGSDWLRGHYDDHNSN